MSLLGTPLLCVLGALTVGLPVAAYLAWSHVPGHRTGRVLLRAGMVVLAQVAAVSLAGAAVNDYGYFYSSWSDAAAGIRQLAGVGGRAGHVPGVADRSAGAPAPHPAPTAGPPPPGRVGRGAPPVSPVGRIDVTPAPRSWAGGVSARPDTRFSAPAQWATLGRLDKVTIRGGISELSSPAYVYLPPQYFQPAYANRRFGALEVFTGYPGTALNLVTRLRYQDVLVQLLAQHRASPLVLVMLRPSVTFPRDTECTDVPAGPQALTFFAADVPTQVAHAYRVRPTGWGAIGDSTGGYCAAKLAMLHPSEFPAAVALSGYFTALHDQTTGDLWGGSTVVRDLNDLHWRLAHLPAPPVSVLVCTSPAEHGPDGYREAQAFVREVRPPMTADLLSVPNGGHNYRTWDVELPTALHWLSDRLPGPGPAPQLARTVR